jgi:hypothetical protein
VVFRSLSGVRPEGGPYRPGVRLLRRIAITVVGGALMLLGVALLILPGPGLLLVAAGLLVLGTEYPWARRRAITVRDKAWNAARASAASPWSTIVAVLASLALVAGGLCWGAVDGLPGGSWWVGGSLMFGGLAALATVVASVVAVRREGAPSEPAAH